MRQLTINRVLLYFWLVFLTSLFRIISPSALYETLFVRYIDTTVILKNI